MVKIVKFLRIFLFVFALVTSNSGTALAQDEPDDDGIPETSCFHEPLLEGEHYEDCQEALKIWENINTPPYPPPQINGENRYKQFIDELIEIGDKFGASYFLLTSQRSYYEYENRSSNRLRNNEKVLDLLKDETHPASKVLYAAVLAEKGHQYSKAGELEKAQALFDEVFEYYFLSDAKELRRIKKGIMIDFLKFISFKLGLATDQYGNISTDDVEMKEEVEILELVADEVALKAGLEAIPFYEAAKLLCNKESDPNFCANKTKILNEKIEAITNR